ncbi:MAG: methyltransferase regulatory domain-containing protein [Proteobacteria bacterium]|nr:methyltransferase regulatory domain-containing protein [Pseudomonadota bacterium]
MSADWTQGYVTDTIYTDGFFKELSPAWLNYVAALKGCLPIRLDRPFTYLELGCGLGRSTSVFAGAFPNAQFIGVDFNPAHIALARRHAEAIGLNNVAFLERGFADVSASDVPECDFIVLHGVYTWVNAEARAEIRRIIRERLKPGGLLYVSYNSLPGWAAASPLRKLMVEAAAQSNGDSIGAVGSAIDFMESLSADKYAYLKANAGTAMEFKNLKARGRNYLAHEFLNAEWALFYSVDVADEMTEAKLSFLGSATLPENHIELLVDKDTADKINVQPSSRLRQLLQDYAVNQRFRRDVFVRGHQRLEGAERDRVFGDMVLGSLIADDQFTAKARVGNREMTFAEKLFPIIKAAMVEGPKTVAQLRALCAPVTDRGATIDNLLVSLVAAGHIAPFAGPVERLVGESNTDQDKNRILLDLAIATKGRQMLVSRVAGTGVSIDPVEAIIARQIGNVAKPGKASAKSLAAQLRENGLRLTKRGQAISSAADELAVADELIGQYLKSKGLVLKRLDLL